MCRASVLMNGVALALAVVPLSTAGASVHGDRLKVVELRPLRFGLIAQMGQAGLVRLAPDGSQYCLNLACLGGGQPGLFALCSPSDMFVQITALSTMLGNAAGDRLMFTPRLSTDNLIVSNGTGRTVFTVGGALQIPGTRDGGVYSGDFQLIVEYQ